MPRRSTWAGAPAAWSLARAVFTCRSTFFLVSPSTTRTSSCLAVMVRMPAWSRRVPSLFTERTSALVPMDTSSTVSPSRAGRVGGGTGASGRRPRRSSASLSRWRARARWSFTCCQFCSFRLCFSISRSWAKTWSLASRAWRSTSSASARAFSAALSRAFSVSRRYSSARAAACAASRRSRAASSRSRSSSWRRTSIWLSTSSKRTFSASMRAAAAWMTPSSSPSRREMAKALDLPGTPMSSR